MATGREPDIAINHDGEAMCMHLANHAETIHYIEDIYDVDPIAAVRGCDVGLLWASPDCKHFSKCKGGKPKSNDIRGMAWVILSWAKKVKPRVICIENVEEFKDWGPLDEDGHPVKDKTGETFKLWSTVLRSAGYRMDMKQLRACDYGAPTTRKRLFIVARRDGKPITWPEPTHGPGLLPYATAAECMDWSVPTPSIFERKKPLADATCRRIAHGIMRYVVNDPDPFIVPEGYAATMIQTGYGERPTQRPRYLNLHEPIGTLMAQGNKHAIVAAWMVKHYTGVVGHKFDRPLGAITTKDHHGVVAASSRGDHAEEVRAFLLKYYGTGVARDLREPLDTITTRDRFALVTVKGQVYKIQDIGMRMLTPRELFTAQGFPKDYVIDPMFNGKKMTKTAQIRMCGNSVSPPMASAIVSSQFPETARAAVTA
jgi:DNA (cytosine-5)-methyltransferase 1